MASNCKLVGVFKPIGDLIRSIPARSRSPKAMVALTVRNAAKDAIAVVCDDLPAEMLAKIKPSVFKNGTLTITAPQMVTSELHVRSEGLKEEINKALGRKIVKSLRFRTI